MTSQSKRDEEIQRASMWAQTLYDAQSKFQGPLIDMEYLPNRSPVTARGVECHWVAHPRTYNLARRWGRDAAIAALSVAPRAHMSRQSVMVMVAKDALADQITSLGGTVKWCSPEFAAIAEFWELIIRFVEPSVTFPWLMRWKEKKDKDFDAARENDELLDSHNAKVAARTAAKRLTHRPARKGKSTKARKAVRP